jgi:hypothetical protein
MSAGAADGRPQLECLAAGGALGGAEIGTLVGFSFGIRVGLSVEFLQQVSDVPEAIGHIMQVMPQPSQVAPT